jgi:hypothetical protein
MFPIKHKQAEINIMVLFHSYMKNFNTNGESQTILTLALFQYSFFIKIMKKNKI